MKSSKQNMSTIRNCGKLTLRHDRQGNKLTITLGGALDAVSAPMLQTFLEDFLSANVSELVFDFDKLDYMSSYGLRVLLKAQKNMDRRKGHMRVCNVKDFIMDLFEETGFLNILTIDDQ